jgi:hypothetical protein
MNNYHGFARKKRQDRISFFSLLNHVAERIAAAYYSSPLELAAVAAGILGGPAPHREMVGLTFFTEHKH